MELAEMWQTKQPAEDTSTLPAGTVLVGRKTSRVYLVVQDGTATRLVDTFDARACTHDSLSRYEIVSKGTVLQIRV